MYITTTTTYTIHTLTVIIQRFSSTILFNVHVDLHPAIAPQLALVVLPPRPQLPRVRNHHTERLPTRHRLARRLSEVVPHLRVDLVVGPAVAEPPVLPLTPTPHQTLVIDHHAELVAGPGRGTESQAFINIIIIFYPNIRILKKWMQP